MENTITAIPTMEEKVVKKCFWRIIPYVALLYMIAFLDRVNISFAALSMNEELGFTATVYGFGAGIFFIGYVLTEVPGNYFMTKTGPRFWIMRILVTWGIISSLTAFVTEPWQFYTVRFFLGVAEASFSPTIIYYLNCWFRGSDQAKALALYLSSMPICNIIAAPVSTWLLGFELFGLHGWQWLFIFEAIPAVVLGVVSYFYLRNDPEEVSWLNSEEKTCLINLLKTDKQAKLNQLKPSLWEACTDRDTIMLGLVFMGWVTGLYGVTMFLPTLIKGLQSTMSNTMVGILSMIPYIAALLGAIFIGWSSDKRNERRWHVIACMVIGAVGMIASVYLADVSMGLTMVAFSLAMIGVMSPYGPFYAIPSSYLTGTNFAISIAFINSIGNCGGFIGPYAVGYIRDLTGSYNSGTFFLAGCLLFSAVCTYLLKKKGKALD